MPPTLQPIEEILKAAQQIKCQLPLTSSIEKCQIIHKNCSKNASASATTPAKNREKNDQYWIEFLKAQQNSSANYIYNRKIHGNYGDAQQPKLEINPKGEAVPPRVINQRLYHMCYIAGLLNGELYYLLSFLINLLTLTEEKQKEYMEHMVNRNLLDLDIMNYLQMISRHPAVGLTHKQLEEFEKNLKNLMDKESCAADSITASSYYNPEHIFIKSPDHCNHINPYEMEHLNMILHSDKSLTAKQTMYLAKFVYKLQQLDKSTREEYLNFLHDKQILQSNKLEYLIVFLVSRAKRINQNKLKNLLKELYMLMEIAPSCPPEPEKETKPKQIKIDYMKIHKALSHLMKSALPNIVRLTDLKNFLKDMISLNEEQIVDVFNNLKLINVMNPARFKFIESFIASGKLGKLDKRKRNGFIELLRKVATAPVSMEIMLQLNIPPSKGPIKDKIEQKDNLESEDKLQQQDKLVQIKEKETAAATATKAPEEIKKPSEELGKKKKAINKTKAKKKIDEKSSSKDSKKSQKKPKKKSAKKKK